MNQDPIIQALSDQVGCYRRLAKLALIQHDHIQNSRTEELLGVLQSRQEVLDQLMELQKVVAPVKQKWADYLASVAPASRQKAEILLAETKTLLEQITNADRNDVLALQARKMNLGRKIQQTSAAKHVNRNYAAAAYMSSRPRMDVQT